MKIIIIFVMFLFVGVFFIVSQNNLALNSSENIDEFILLYKGWVYEISENFKDITGHIVKMNWLPGENTGK